MPHIVLETTSDLYENANIPDILEALVRRLSAFETIDAKSIKAYHGLRTVWCMGEGGPPGMAHCTVGLASGRSPELRKAISEAMYDEMKSHFGMSLEEKEVSLTLEVREFEKETYQKMQS